MLARLRVIEREPEHLSVKERSPESQFQRLKAMLELSSSADFGSAVGRMNVRGEFKIGREAPNTTKSRFDAMNWFYGLYHDHKRAIDAKGIAPQSMEVGSKGQPPDPFSEAGKRLTRKEKAIDRDYKAARLSALACGAERYAIFLAVVIQDTEPNYNMKQAVVQVSEALRRHRQLSSRHRQGRRA